MSAGDSEIHRDPKDEMADETAIVTTTPANVESGNLRDEMMQNPRVLAALQQQLDSMVGTNSGYIESLPAEVKRRIKALKNIQVKVCQLECEFYKEVHELEEKYCQKYQPLHDQRKEIVAGRYEPNDAECEWESEDEDGEEKKDSHEEKAVEDKLKVEELKGIPNFWLTIFKSSPILQEMVQEHDEPILECLEDIKVILSKPATPMNFTLEFHFASNPYFTNEVLVKQYKLVSEPDKNDPFSFEGPEIVSSTGCTINWNKGKNVTVKVVKKRQKHKNKGTLRTVSKEMPTDSFFNFFDPPQVPDDDEELDEDMEALLATDIEIGHLLRERVVPRAVLFFTGEASDDEDYDDEEEDSDNDAYGADDGSDDNDADYDPEKDPHAKETPQECNQQ